MNFKSYLFLVENKKSANHIWILCSKDDAKRIMRHGPMITKSRTDVFSDSPEFSQQAFDDFVEHNGKEAEPIILEFKIIDHDAIRKVDDRITVQNPKAVKFRCVFDGVIDDPVMKYLADDQLDEVALFGLKRCTAVTCNALLHFFHKQDILLGDVPETDQGVLEVLTKNGLVYKPIPNSVGRTVQQFISLNRRGAYYIATPGHAMAVINGEIFDAENKGADGRKIIEAFLISTR